MKKTITIKSHYDILQRHLQAKSGLRTISPGDCKQISSYIEDVTGKLISETTLKRFFGFARQDFQFSSYTLNTLCEYAGFNDWSHFCETVSNEEDHLSQYTLWEESRQKALIVTHITHTTLKNLTTIPFELTVSRSSIETDFDFFLRSNYQLFCLTGNPGIGKTVQMIHLAEKFFLKDKAPYGNSIIWFLKKGATKELLSYDIDLTQSIDEQFRIGKKLDFLEYFHQHPQEVKGKLVLMLDGFDEYIYDTKQLYHVFQKVKDLLGYFKDAGWLKIVFSFRPSTWQFLQKELNQSEYLEKTWFSGIFYKEETNSNLLPLEKKEASKVIKAIHTQNHIPLVENKKLYSLFSHPHYINLYYQLLKNDQRRAMKGNTLYFELIASFVFQKIHHSRYGTGMRALLSKLVELSNYGKSDRAIDKGLLLNGNDAFTEAYQELVTEGFIQEIKGSKKFDYNSYVRFAQESLSIWFIAMELIKQEPDESAYCLIKKVLREYTNEEKRKMLVQFILWHKMNDSQVDIIKVIFHSRLSTSEKWDLLHFVCDMLEDNLITIKDAQWKKFIAKSNEFIATHFIELNDLDKTHEDVLQLLLKYATDPVDKANLWSLMAIFAALRLDKPALEQAMSRLKKTDQRIMTDHYPFHPLQIFEFIFNYYSQGYINHEFLISINGFIENPPVVAKDSMPDTEEILSYQMGIFILALSGCTKDVIAFTNTIRYLYPRLFSAHLCNGFAMHLLFRHAFACLRNNMKIQAKNILARLEKCGSIFEKEEGTHSALLLEILKGEVAMAEEDNDTAVKHFLKAYRKGKQKKFAMLQIYAALPLIRIYKQQNDFSGTLNILKDVRKIISQIQFPVEDFMLKQTMDKV